MSSEMMYMARQEYLNDILYEIEYLIDKNGPYGRKDEIIDYVFSQYTDLTQSEMDQIRTFAMFYRRKLWKELLAREAAEKQMI